MGDYYGGGGGGDPGGGGSWDSGGGGGDGTGDGGGGDPSGFGPATSDFGPATFGSDQSSFGPDTSSFGPDTSGGASSDPSAGGSSDLGGPGSGSPSDGGGGGGWGNGGWGGGGWGGGPSGDGGAGSPGDTGGGPGGTGGGPGDAGGGAGGAGGPGDTGAGSGSGDPQLTRSDTSFGGGPGSAPAILGGLGGDGTSTTDALSGIGLGGGQAGPGASAAVSGGGYGDPLASSDPTDALSVSTGDVLGTGSVPPTAGASAGTMLAPDTQRLANASAAEDAANEELLGTQNYDPGTQLPSGEFRDAPTPGPAMSPGTEQVEDPLAYTRYAEVGQSDANTYPSYGTPDPYSDVGKVLPTDRASQGSMLTPDNQQSADLSMADALTRMQTQQLNDQYYPQTERAMSLSNPIGLGTSDVVPPDQYWSNPFENTTKAPFGVDQNEIDFLNPNAPAPTAIAQKDQEQAPGPVPGGVGSTQNLVPDYSGPDTLPFASGTYNQQPGQVLGDPAATVRSDAANPPANANFTGYAPGALFTGMDPNLTVPEGSGLPGPPPGPDINRLFFQSLPDAPSYQLSGSLQYDPNAITPTDTSIQTNNAMLAPGSLDLTATFPQETTPTQQDVAAQYGATGLGGYNSLMQGGGAPSTAAPPATTQRDTFADQFGPAEPSLLANQQRYGPPAPSDFAGRFAPAEPDLLANQQTTSQPLVTGPLGPKSVTPDVVRAPSATPGPDTATTPGTSPSAPTTPGVPPDTGGGRGPAAPSGAPADTQIAGALSEPTPRGQFEGGPSPSQRGLPPPPQLVNAMLSNASPIVQQAAGSLSPQQQIQVSQYAFGLMNQYRQMLASQGGLVDPSSAEWQMNILPQVRQQTQQYVMQLTGSANPQAVQQILG